MRRLPAPERRRGLTRMRAVLAGGLVFGVGAAVTLAAWTDQEHASSGFTAGTFSIVGAADGVTFTDHPTAPGATLTFAVAPTAMAPGSTVYALYSVKTAPTSVPGSIQLSADAANSSGLGAYLTYGVTRIAGTSCTAVTFAGGSVDVATGSALTAGAAGSVALSGAGASVVNYCFAVTLPVGAPNAAQGTTLTAHWIINGTT
ncbi:hypothetical protein E3T55_17535 [Cryobacterium frigoriphilum]|uniref:SipW-cognate class signal peptide n=1 Tax=Cryobacterium frigoriphilum TaxID=1259150 RepID=A0A4R8ZUC4_9MICO|nr:SipW-dependent-type signal peptide-containing protein [Cryobacterium frigoriphilum]TFD46205.1 hypothetical protein E3T55_17535 [Cryobacterium frigoriphilum]